MKNYSDEFWYMHILDKDSVGKQLNLEEKSTIIKYSMQEAERQLKLLGDQYGKRTVKGYLDYFGFHIETEKPELMPSFLYMGMMGPEEKKVLLNETVITLGESRMEIRLSSDSDIYRCFRDIILWHELFHVLEEQRPQIYTRSVQARCSFLGLFKRM